MADGMTGRCNWENTRDQELPGVKKEKLKENTIKALEEVLVFMQGQRDYWRQCAKECAGHNDRLFKDTKQEKQKVKGLQADFDGLEEILRTERENNDLLRSQNSGLVEQSASARREITELKGRIDELTSQIVEAKTTITRLSKKHPYAQKGSKIILSNGKWFFLEDAEYYELKSDVPGGRTDHLYKTDMGTWVYDKNNLISEISEESAHDILIRRGMHDGLPKEYVEDHKV